MRNTRGSFYYGWLVVSVSFAALFVNYGVRYTSTVLFKDAVGELGTSRGAGSLPFTVMVAVYALGAPLVGRLVDRYGPRWIIAGGAVLAGGGLWLCSRISSLLAFTFFFGVVFGTGGNGIGLVPTNTAVAAWFRRRMGLALGIATMGIGFGTVVLPLLAEVVLSRYGWRASFQFLGYVTAAVAIPALVLLRGKRKAGAPASREAGAGTAAERESGDASAGPNLTGEAVTGNAQAGETAAGPAGGTVAGPRREDPAGVPLSAAIRTAAFWRLFFSFVLVVVAIYGVMLHQVPFATDQGIDKWWATLSVTVVGLTSIAGRLFFGWLSDRTGERKRALYPAFAMVGLGMLVLVFTRQAWSLMVFASLFGFGYAAYGPVVPAIVADVFGKASMGAVFGAITTGGALGGAAGPYLTGLIYDLTGGYFWAWMLGLACAAGSLVLLSGVRAGPAGRACGSGGRAW